MDQKNQDDLDQPRRDGPEPDGDKTQIKATQDSLLEVEKRFEVLLDLSVDSYWEQDQNFRYTKVLGNGGNFDEAELTDFIGKTRWELPTPEGDDTDWDEHKEMLARHEDFQNLEFKRVDQSGETIWVATSGVPIFDPVGNFTGYHGTCRNITARKTTEAELRASEERLKLAFDVAKIGFFELDVMTDQLTLENREFRLLDLPAENSTISWASYKENIHPDDLQSVIETERYILENRSPTSVEYRVINPDGSIRWIQASCGSRDSNDGTTIAQIIGVNVDTTRRKEAEIALDRSRQKLAELNQTLEDRVAARTAELKSEAQQHAETQTMLAASQRLDSIGQLAGGIAHDSNNLLSIILGNLELAALKVTDPEEREMIEDAQAAAMAGVDLNQRLLGFARKQKLAPVRLQVGSHVLGTVRLLERTIREDVRIVTKIERNIWDIVADSSELTNALVNLAVNARDAMNDGGFLHIEARNYKSESKNAKKDRSKGRTDYVEIAVTDTGAGMPADVLEKAFDPFFTTKPQGKGTGLGLSSVYGFVEQSGGFIKIDSHVGEGTTVRIFLPRALEVEKPKAMTQKSTEIPESGGELILVVEDEPNVLATTVKRLKHFGYQVIEASNGLEAVKVLQEGNPIKLVFSDIVMPGGMNGYHLDEWMRNHVPSIKILLTSGYDDPDQENGKHDIQVLPKPHSLEDLAREIRRVLENQPRIS